MTRVIPIVSFSQTDYLSQISASRSKFSKQEFVSATYNTIISFALNANPKPSFAKINVLVRQRITIVPPIVLRKK